MTHQERLSVTDLVPGGEVRELGRRTASACLGAGPRRLIRSALPTTEGGIVLVDGLRRAVLILMRDHVRYVSAPLRGGLWRDPVFAEPVGDRFLVTDAGLGMVVECDASGKSYWTYDCRSAPGGTARDPDSGTTYIALPDAGDVIGVGRDGDLRWRYRCGRDAAPVAVRLCRDGGVLITDRRRHTVSKVRPDGATVFSFGLPGQPDSGDGALNTPGFACETPTGSVLISDTKNNRLVEVDAQGSVTWTHGGRTCGTAPGLLRFPLTAVRREDQSTLVADAANGRVLLISDFGEETLFGGGGALEVSELALPRGASFTDSRQIRVTDCYNNRVLLVDADGAIRWQLAAVTGATRAEDLWWPRYWTGTPDDAVIVDGRHGRLVRVNRRGELIAELAGLVDPHHVQLLPDGHLLVCDSAADRVLELDWSGRTHWVCDEASDPHEAHRLPSGATLIADTGRNRIVEVDAAGRPVWAFGAADALRATGLALAGPRSVHRLRSGSTLILDSANDRLLQIAPNRSAEWVFHPSDWDGVGRLCAPRCVNVDDAERIAIISDFENHRVLTVPIGTLTRRTDERAVTDDRH